MKQIIVDRNNFDFDRFVQLTLDFNRTVLFPEFHPSVLIVKVNELGGKVKYGPDEGRSNFFEELIHGELLFFPFSSTNVDEVVTCADQVKREIPMDSKLSIGEMDCVGYLFELKVNNFVIDSSIHAGGMCGMPPSVDIEYCDILDKPMATFIHQFI